MSDHDLSKSFPVDSTGAEAAAVVECRDCTVPTTNPDGVCGFCRDYTPPADVDDSPVEMGVGPSIAEAVAAIDRAMAACKSLQDAFEAITE